MFTCIIKAAIFKKAESPVLKEAIVPELYLIIQTDFMGFW